MTSRRATEDHAEALEAMRGRYVDVLRAGLDLEGECASPLEHASFLADMELRALDELIHRGDDKGVKLSNLAVVGVSQMLRSIRRRLSFGRQLEDEVATARANTKEPTP